MKIKLKLPIILALVKYDIFGNDFKLHAKTFFTKSNKICASYLQKFEKNSLLYFARICNECRFLQSQKRSFFFVSNLSIMRAQERPTFQINLIGGVFYSLSLNCKKLKNNTANMVGIKKKIFMSLPIWLSYYNVDINNIVEAE